MTTEAKRLVPLQERYAGQRILLTGATGMLGKSVLEKILRDLPSVEKVYLLVRPRRSMDAIERAGQRFERTTRRVLRSRNPLRGGAHLLSWAAEEASRATESFLNLAPSMARSFDEGNRDREERSKELEHLLIYHLLVTLEDADHLQF